MLRFLSPCPPLSTPLQNAQRSSVATPMRAAPNHPDALSHSLDTVRSIIHDNSCDLRRTFKRMDNARTGRIPLGETVRAIVTTLALNPARDTAAVRRVCEAASDDGTTVTVSRLFLRTHSDSIDPTRYCAAGIMDVTIQRATTGAVATPLGYRYQGPPFAVSNDAEQMTSIFRNFHSGRRGKLGAHLKTHSANGEWLTHAEFTAAMPGLDRYQVPDHEVTLLIESLDPGRKRGRVYIEEFLDMFASEYMKNKSCRSTVNGKTALQWPASLTDSYSRKQRIEELRNKRTPKLRIGARAKKIPHPSLAPPAPLPPCKPKDANTSLVRPRLRMGANAA